MDNTQQQRREAIYLALAQIPKGKVISYGDLAKLAGLTNGARLVGKTLSNLPKGSTLPWYRVVNSQGKISLPPDSPSYEQQHERLAKEGVEVINGKINLRRFGF
jgi:methylated-DNA-protein-cysteine methyltransferase-like protein